MVHHRIPGSEGFTDDGALYRILCKIKHGKIEYHNQYSAEALDAIAQLVNSATTDKNISMTLTNTNVQLCKEITEVNTKLAAAPGKIANMQEAKDPHYFWSPG